MRWNIMWQCVYRNINLKAQEKKSKHLYSVCPDDKHQFTDIKKTFVINNLDLKKNNNKVNIFISGILIYQHPIPFHININNLM